MNFYKFFSTFVGHFCPPGSGSGSTDRLNTDPIRIRIRNPEIRKKGQPEQLSCSCGAGGAVIKLLPGFGAVIKKTPDPYDLIKDSKEF